MVASLAEASEVIEKQNLQIEAVTKKLHSSLPNVKLLQHQMDQLLRRVYGRPSENLDPKQLMFESLLLESLEEQALHPEPFTELPPPVEPERKRSVKTKRNHSGCLGVPEHLERLEIILDIPEEEKVCPQTSNATALFCGLIQSRKAWVINLWGYFNDMLQRIMSHPEPKKLRSELK
jgi:transposase